MPALNFKPQFAPMVRAGIDTAFAKANPGIYPKRQTIRAMRKNPIKEGDTLYLYTGMRTKNCRKLGETVCKSAIGFKILNHSLLYVIYLNEKIITPKQIDQIIKEDGFEHTEDFINFFQTTHGLPFTGQLIKW